MSSMKSPPNHPSHFYLLSVMLRDNNWNILSGEMHLLAQLMMLHAMLVDNRLCFVFYMIVPNWYNRCLGNVIPFQWTFGQMRTEALLYHLQVELEKLRLLCERVIKREKVKVCPAVNFTSLDVLKIEVHLEARSFFFVWMMSRFFFPYKHSWK